ncbi:MAG TPA: lactate utilization protein [Syntrophobacter fumaroxidans]|nr:lactate utilization protein [Syntrophobacter fumaroxidans]
MDKPFDHYWQLRLSDLKETLEANNFEVFLADNKEQACKLVLERIIPGIGAKSISWGGSMTFVATGLYEKVKALPGLEVIDTYDRSIPREEATERRRRALLVDLYITGTNAVTETGKLVNLDMTGNRVASIIFGPRNVILLIGRNKVVPDLEDAMLRVKNYTAPVNAMRLDMQTPCVSTSFCEECKSPSRICNTWTITEKSFPKGRIKIVLINEDLGI